MARKVCSKCGSEKPRSEFYKNAECRDGHRPECKRCFLNYMANRYDGRPPRERFAPRSGAELEPISYVYLIKLPDGTPLYVGKGRGIRYLRHAKGTHNKSLAAAFAKFGDLPIELVKWGMTDDGACLFERELIAKIGRVAHGGPLVNMTDGGNGLAGAIISEETRRRRSIARRGKKMSPEYCAAMKAAASSPEGRERRRRSALQWHASMTDQQKRDRSVLISKATIEAMRGRPS